MRDKSYHEMWWLNDIIYEIQKHMCKSTVFAFGAIKS